MGTNINNNTMCLKSRTKWFWIGLVISLISPLSGFIYGLALLSEKEYKRESIIIITLAIIVFIFTLLIGLKFGLLSG